MIGIGNIAKLQEYEANTTLDNLTNREENEVENKMAGCLLESRGMLATMYLNDRYKDKRKEAGI